MQTLREIDQRNGTHGMPARQTEAPNDAAAAVRIGYLLSRYPAVSHTFFLAEVLGLRARGLHIETASINPPDRPMEQLPPNEAQEARSTVYVKGGSKLAALGRIVNTAATNPGVLFRGLAAVFSMPRLTLRMRLMWLFYLAEAMLVGGWMRDRKLTHLHVHFGGPVASVGLLTSIAWQLPYSLTIHGPEELLNHESYHLREKLERASFVVCISDFCRSQLCQLTPPSMWDKFKVIRLGVDPATLHPGPGRMQSAGTLHLVCTGRLVAAKGHHILLQALDQLEARGISFDTTLIGSGPELASLQAYVKKHGLTDNVTFTSALSHPETLGYVRSADMFVLASFAEGIPVALMEAMALGVPCLSTTIAGIPELIRNGIDGILVPPANVSALADALEQLATDAALRQRLAETARQRIISDYNLPLNHEYLARTLEELIPATPAGDAKW